MKLLLAATLILSTQALAEPNQPEKCPSASAIHSTSFQLVNAFQEQGTWIVVTAADEMFDTNDHWSLIVARVPAKDKQEAYKLAVKSLQNISFMRGPEFTGLERFACEYNSQESYDVFTLNPPWIHF